MADRYNNTPRFVKVQFLETDVFGNMRERPAADVDQQEFGLSSTEASNKVESGRAQNRHDASARMHNESRG